VKLQLFHLARDGETGVFSVQNQAALQSWGGDLDDYLAAGHPFLTLAPTATASFTGNVLNTTEAQMPVNSANSTALGNLRYDAAAIASSNSWSNGGGNRAWNNAANWINGVPGSTKRAVIAKNAVPGPVIATGVAAVAKNLVVGDGTSTNDTVDLTGGSLTTAGWLVLGYGAGNRGTLTVSNGTVTVGSDLYVGLNGTGKVFLAGGTLHAGSLNLPGGGLVDLSAGQLVIQGNQTAAMNSHILENRIVGYQGVGSVNVDYHTLNPGRTTVWATPPDGYDTWAHRWGVPLGATTNDYDGDLLANLGEYALNGNPTNRLDSGSQPTLSQVGGEWHYVHLRRNDDTNLTYLVQTTTNLGTGVWSSTHYTVIGTNVTGGVFDQVTNRISTDAQQTFIRLKMTYP
jgi:hypothetical protein